MIYWQQFLIYLFIFSPSTLLAQPDPQLMDDDPYEYNWRLKEYVPYQSTWRSRRDREGFPRFEEKTVQNYLNQLLSGEPRLPPQGPIRFSGADTGVGGIDDELLPPPPRHRPQYKPVAQQQFTFHPIHKPPLDQNGVQFALPPSDPRFFDSVKTPTIPTDVDLTDEYPASVEVKMPLNIPENLIETEMSTEDDNHVFKTPLIDFDTTKENIILIALVVGSSTAAIFGLILLIYGFVRLQRNAKAAADVEYPAYGVTGPNKEATPTGDRRLAHSAQMYHYQLTKQQIIAMESTRGERRGSISEADSDDENEEGDYTVYECPGLAPTGEMEVKNPLFQDDPTPAAVISETPAAGGDGLNNDLSQQQQPPLPPPLIEPVAADAAAPPVVPNLITQLDNTDEPDQKQHQQ